MALRKPKVTNIDVIDSIGGDLFNGKNYTLRPKNAFWIRNNYYIGVQHDCWEEDEIAWDNTDKGAWSCLGSIMRDEPRDLSLENAQYIKSDVDNIAILSSGTTSRAYFQIDSRTPNPVGGKMTTPGGDSSGKDDYSIDYSIINTLTGEEINGTFNKTIIGNPTVFTPTFTLPDGSYIYRAKLRAYNKYKLPPEYDVKKNVKYQYIEDGFTFIYDPIYNIGRIPSDRNHPLLAERNRIVNLNLQKDNPAWIIYLVSPEQQSGEWSQLKFVVGNGQWSSDNSKITSIGPVLIRKNNILREVINFDSLARSISASYYVSKDVKNNAGQVIISKGSFLFGGNRSTQSGAVLALWVLRPNDSIDLLGTNLNPSTGACECHLVDHSATDIRQDSNGNIFILTKCSLHKYTPEARSKDLSLPGIPEDSDGHPGGQALNIIGDKIYFFSEYFGQFGEIDISFYNFLVDQRGNTRHSGDGTVFHGPNCATTWLNKLWGIYQDKPFSDPTATQYLAHYDGLTWAKKEDPLNAGKYIVDADLNFKASEYRWQRVIQCNNVLHLFGKQPDVINNQGTLIQKAENGIMGISDETGFTIMDMNYRILRGDVSPTNDSELDRLIVIAKGVHDNVLDTTTYYIIEIDYLGEPEIFENCGDCFCLAPPLTTQEDVDNYFETHAHYLWWENGEWTAYNYPPEDVSVCYLKLVSEENQSGGFIIKYCDICAQDSDCLNNCDNFFCWDAESKCFSISKTTLLLKYGITSEDLSQFYILNDTCYSAIENIDNQSDYLLKSEDSDYVYLCQVGDDLGFDPSSAFGPGNALDIQTNGNLCLVHTCPPYDYTECSILKIVYDKVTRGHWAKNENTGEFILDDNGNKIFVPCDPINAGEALDTMPEGTKWKVINFPRHGLPVNIIELVDLMKDYRLKQLDQIYFTAWYRTTNSPSYQQFSSDSVTIDSQSNLTNEQQIEKANHEWDIEFLSNFNKRIKYGKLNKFKKPPEEIVEVVILVAPKASPINLLPAILRVI